MPHDTDPNAVRYIETLRKSIPNLQANNTPMLVIHDHATNVIVADDVEKLLSFSMEEIEGMLSGCMARVITGSPTYTSIEKDSLYVMCSDDESRWLYVMGDDLLFDYMRIPTLDEFEEWHAWLQLCQFTDEQVPYGGTHGKTVQDLVGLYLQDRIWEIYARSKILQGPLVLWETKLYRLGVMFSTRAMIRQELLIENLERERARLFDFCAPDFLINEAFQKIVRARAVLRIIAPKK